MNLNWQKLKKILIGLIILNFITIFSACLYKYFTFAYNGFDLAIFNQVFYNSSQGRFFQTSLHPTSYLGDHFTPIILILLPLYFIFKSPLNLLFIQTAFISLAAWPLYLFCKKHLNQKQSLVIILLYLFNPFTLTLGLLEFHLLSLLPFFIFWLFYFYDQKKFKPYLIFLFLSLFIREDVAFIIFMFGIIALIDKQRLKWILIPLIISSVYFFIAIKTISFFAVSGNYKFLQFYGWLGNSLSEIFFNFFLKAPEVIIKILNYNNLKIIFVFFLIFLFIPLVRPKYLLLGLGMFLQISLSSGNSGINILKIHYGAVFLSFFTIAAIFSLEYLKQNKIYIRIKEKFPLLFTVYCLSLFIFIFLSFSPARALAQNIKNLNLNQIKLKSEFIKQIPSNANLIASYDFLAPLSSRKKLYSLNYVFLGQTQYGLSDYNFPEDAQYILINNSEFLTYHLQYADKTRYKYPQNYSNFRQNLVEENFSTSKIDQNISLLEKNVAEPKIIIMTHDDQSVVDNLLNINLADQIEFIGYNKAENYYSLFFKTLTKIDRPYFIKINEQIYPLGYGLFPTNNWPADKLIQINFYDIEKINDLEIIDLSGYLTISDLGTVHNKITAEKSIGFINL